MSVTTLIGSMKKAKIKIMTKEAKELECTFNPSQYVIRSAVNYGESNVLGELPHLQFINETREELSLTLYFASDYNELLPGGVSNPLLQETLVDPVSKDLNILRKATLIAGEVHRPPMVSFEWGNLNFKGYITSMTQTYTMFSISGKPLRAKVDLTIKSGEKDSEAKKKSPLESPDRTKSRTMSEGMSLWELALEEYGDARMWRVIAKANHLENPLDVKVGQQLKIPAI